MSPREDNIPAASDEWIAEQRDNVLQYLEKQGLQLGDLPDEPEWSAMPYAALWRVKSLDASEGVGWWVVTGDLRTDHIPGQEAADARSALRVFERMWRKHSLETLEGKGPSGEKGSYPETGREMGDPLGRRADFLRQWAEDDDTWLLLEEAARAARDPLPTQVGDRILLGSLSTVLVMVLGALLVHMLRSELLGLRTFIIIELTSLFLALSALSLLWAIARPSWLRGPLLRFAFWVLVIFGILHVGAGAFFLYICVHGI